VTWAIALTPTARAMLEAISDRWVQRQIRSRIEALARDPEQQGKPLLGELQSLWSVRAVRQRYRILYRVDRGKVLVLVVAMGLRKEGERRDIYALAKKLLRLGLLDRPE